MGPKYIQILCWFFVFHRKHEKLHLKNLNMQNLNLQKVNLQKT